MRYLFHYFSRETLEPIAELRTFWSDAGARERAVLELLQMPGRGGVDVWAGGRLVYRRRRRASIPDQPGRLELKFQRS